MALVSKRPLSSETEALVKRSRSDGTIIQSGPKRHSALTAPTMKLEGHEGEIYSMKFNPEGRLLATSSFDKMVFVWMTYGDCEQVLTLKGHKNAVLEVHWADAGEKLVTCSADTTVQVFDSESGRRIKKFAEHNSVVNSVCPARGGFTLISGSDDGTARLWDMRVRGSQLTLPSKYQITSVCMDSKGEQVFTGSLDNEIKVWDIRKEDVVYTLNGHTDTITGMSLSPDGSYILSNAMDNTARIWDIRPFAQERQTQIFRGHQHNFEKILLKCSWSPDGSLIGVGSSNRFVYVYSTATAQIKYKLPGHAGSVNEVVFHPEEPIIGSCSSDKHIYLGEIDYKWES